MKPDILLFHPPNILNPNALKSSILSSMMCGYGLLHIGAHLKSRGYNVECWNIPLAYYYGFNNSHIKEIIKSYNPLIVGIELNWLHLSRGALDLADLIKKLFPNVPVVVGGVHATLFAEEILQSNKSIDIIVKGEAEKIMEEIANKVEKKQDFSIVTGTISKREGRILKNEGQNIFKDIDSIPPYSVDFLMPKIFNPYDLAAINTCRGPCNYNCIYCIGANSCYALSPRSSITFHSVSWIIKQIKILLDSAKRITIQDYNYCNPKFICELSKAIQQEKLQESIEFFNYAIVPTQNMNKQIMQALAKAGVDNIDVGVESGSDRILRLLNRPYHTQHASDVIKNAIKSGILPKTFWMITGFETQDDLNINKLFLKETIEMGAVPRWVTALCVIPETILFNNAEKYKINLNMSSFEDYMVFSTEKSNRSAYYSRCITHQTNLMNVHDMLNAVNELKTFIINQKATIFEKLAENKKYYSAAQPKLFEDLLIKQAKHRLKILRSTFF